MRLLALLSLCALLVAPSAFAQNGSAASGTFFLADCRIETVAAGTIESGGVLLRDGRIEAVGADATAPSDATVIPCDGGTVYPGMIDSGTRLGLLEVGSLDETRDFREVGEVTPQMQALTAVNPNSVLIPEARLGGVTTVLTVPDGGTMPGTAALIHLHGYTPAQMDAGFRAVVLDYPSSARRGSFDRRDQSEIDKAFDKALETVNETWDSAELYARIDSAYAATPDPERAPAYQPEMAALLPVVRGEVPLLITVNAARDIQHALGWVEERGVRAVLSGVAEGWRVADEIADAGIPVLAGPVLSLPTRDSDRYDKPYQNAALLHQAGVQVALRTGEVENVRNLAFNAGFAAAYGREIGFGPAEALRAVTLTPAEIFGIADGVGSIEVGKRGTLFVATGDPFETATQITHVFIDGYQVPMESRQTELYDEFLQRSPGLAK
ncbi:MAG: amidohydrolase family protein [Bacteroidota bacterium]